VNAISFALAQVLIAGVNLFLLATIVNVLLGWPIWVSVIVAAAIVLSYITLGGLSAAIYNEVLQFFVIVAALLPLTLVGLHKVGGWQGLVDKVTASPGGGEQMSAWPGNALSGFHNSFLSVIGIVFGLGFVLSFGYWTTNFTEVQRALASKNMSAARRTPIIGSFPKMFIPFIVIIPGIIAAVVVPELQQFKATGSGEVDYNDALLLLMRDLLPNGMLGLAITGLLASFMAGMAANLSSFNTVMSYDIIERYILKDRPDDFYLRTGRWVTVGGTLIAIGTAAIASGYSNLMDYLQQLFSFFNAPLFATFILGMFWKRMTAAAGWIGLVSGTTTAVVVYVLSENGVINLPGQGASFVGAGAAFVVDILVSVLVSLATKAKRDEELVGLVYSLTPKEQRTEVAVAGDGGWYRKPVLLAGISLAMTIALNIIFS
jgi:SSS family solute:Na+ symporter